MKSIIVPTDFSEQSEYALKVAASLAKKHKAEIILLHMLELNQAMIASSDGLHPEYTVFLIKEAEKKLAAEMDKPFLKDINLVPIIKHFKVFSEVNEVAFKHNADLVVMGSHGVDGLKEMFVGSNTEKVVRNSDVPVLVIKDYIENFEVKEFVFACDFSDENLLAFQRAKDFADLLSTKVNLVYINTSGDNFRSTGDAYKRINDFLAKANAGLEVQIYNDYSVERGVLNYSEQMGADLIGIPTHGRKGLSHFFMGSVGEDIANHSKIPVVTFKIS